MGVFLLAKLSQQPLTVELPEDTCSVALSFEIVADEAGQCVGKPDESVALVFDAAYLSHRDVP